MTIFQIVAVIFSLFMIYVVMIHQKKKTLSVMETSLWYSVWVVFAIIAFFPSLLDGVTATLRFSRVFDLLVVIAFMVLSTIVFATYFAQKEAERKLEQFVRRRALLEAQPPKRSAQKKRHE